MQHPCTSGTKRETFDVQDRNFRVAVEVDCP